jgi:hypothetical protein
MPRDMVLGDTVGEAYTKGISHVGKLFATDPPEWWWDTAQNVVYFGDPDLRMLVPGTEYGDENYWEKKDTKAMRYDEEANFQGHMPFGATHYPNERQPQSILENYMAIIIVAAIALVLVGVVIYKKRKTKK